MDGFVSDTELKNIHRKKHLNRVNSEPLPNNWKIFCQTKWKIEQTETVKEPEKETEQQLEDIA